MVFYPFVKVKPIENPLDTSLIIEKNAKLNRRSNTDLAEFEVLELPEMPPDIEFKQEDNYAHALHVNMKMKLANLVVGDRILASGSTYNTQQEEPANDTDRFVNLENVIHKR